MSNAVQGPEEVQCSALVASVHCYLLAADYDETGTILWPAAQMLADYLAKHEGLLRGRNAAVELGSGIGLVGLLASLFCRTVLTDHNAHVLDVLRRSAATFSQKNG